MVLAYLAVAWRAVSGRYAVFWLGLFGLFTLLPSFWMSPGGPSDFDETAHFALLRNVISSGRLFQHTPLLPIGTFYPGLESASATIHWLTGLSPWDSALTLIAVVHCLIPVQVYYVARALPVPPRWAAAAGLVYAANPSFVYFDTQFSYESVAILLMLTIVRLYVEALAAERSGCRTWRQSLSASLLIAVISFGLVVTHHLYSLTGIALLLAGALFLKPISGFADRKGGWRRLFVRWMPVLTLATCLGLWVVFVAPTTVGYLFPHVSGTVSELFALATRSKASSGATRTIFSNSGAPSYEHSRCNRRAHHDRGRVPLCGNSLAAEALPALELPVVVRADSGLPGESSTDADDPGAKSAHFTWPSMYVGVALLPAALVILFELDKRSPWLKRTAATAGAAVFAVLLVGNVAVGTPPDHRFPGPYEFGSDTLSVTPETLRFAHWVQAHLGPGAHVVTDRFTALALTAHANAVTPMQLLAAGRPANLRTSGTSPARQHRPSCLPWSVSETTIWPSMSATRSTRDIPAPVLQQGEPKRVPLAERHPPSALAVAAAPVLLTALSPVQDRLPLVLFVVSLPCQRSLTCGGDGGPACRWRETRWRETPDS